MLNIYQKIARSRVFDTMVEAEFTTALRSIEHIYGISPIENMTDRERNALEHRLVSNYDKSLARIYECYDKLLGLIIPPFNISNLYSVIDKVESDEQAKNILLILLGINTFYGLVPNADIIERHGVKHFVSRYELLSELGSSNCCALI